MQQRIDVMIVGAQKAGTTSLLRYLGEHPACVSHPQKEFGFFADESEYRDGFQEALNRYFSHSPGKRKLIAKNAGMFTKREGLARLKEHNPACQLVIILRNPVERTYSSFLMEKNFGSVRFDFKELPALLKAYQESRTKWDYEFFIEYGLYAKYLRGIYEFFPPGQVRVLLFDDLKNSPAEVCKTVFHDIHVDPGFVPDIHTQHNTTQKTRSFLYARMVRHLLKNESALKRSLKKVISGNKIWKYGEMLREVNKTKEKHKPMDPEIRSYLVNFFEPYNNELSEMIGRDLSGWNQ